MVQGTDTSWSIEWTDDGDLRASRVIPHDGVLVYTTASAHGHSTRRKQSEYGLSPREVVEKVAAESSRWSVGLLAREVIRDRVEANAEDDLPAGWATLKDRLDDRRARAEGKWEKWARSPQGLAERRSGDSL